MKILAIACLLFFASLAHANPSCSPTDSPNKNYHWNLNQDTLVMQMWCFDSEGLQLFNFVPDLGVILTPQCQSSLGNFTAGQTWFAQLLTSMTICSPLGLSKEQLAQANAIQKQWAPRLFTPTTQYVMEADYHWIKINGQYQTVPAGTPCNGGSVGGTKTYFDVSGITSEQGNVLPEGSYTGCSIKYPPSPVTGWN
jgi:hypothetical protein